jgi:multidrug efflux pump subunit AcrB
VVWQYTGLPPDEMAGRMSPITQLRARADHDGQRHRAHRGKSYNRLGIVKIFFQPNVDIRTANAQVTAISQTVLKQMPPGTTPPLILNYNASTVPIIQLALSGKGCPSSSCSTSGINFMRRRWSRCPAPRSLSLSAASSARSRSISIRQALQARGPVGQDVANALAAQNLITPAGTEKIGDFEYNIQLNNAPLRIDELNDLPIKTVNGAMVYVRDVAHVRDGTRRRPTSCTSTATARC